SLGMTDTDRQQVVTVCSLAFGGLMLLGGQSTMSRDITRWRRWDSNPRPPACKAGALPAELRPRLTSNGTWPPREHPCGGAQSPGGASFGVYISFMRRPLSPAGVV